MDIKTAIEVYEELRQQESRIEADKKIARDVIVGYLKTHESTEMIVVGRVVKVSQTTKHGIDQEKLRKVLLLEGVSPTVVENAFRLAEKITVSSRIDVREWKEPKKEGEEK